MGYKIKRPDHGPAQINQDQTVQTFKIYYFVVFFLLLLYRNKRMGNSENYEKLRKSYLLIDRFTTVNIIKDKQNSCICLQ